MKTDKDWEARARELAISPCTSVRGVYHITPWMEVNIALQLGREMAAEARNEAQNEAWLVEARLDLQRQAADARAEEIAQLIDRARGGSSFSLDEHGRGWQGGLADAARIARRTITKPKEPPKTRVQVLEEALRLTVGRRDEGHERSCSCVYCAGRRALEYHS